MRKPDAFSDAEWPVSWNGEKQLVIADLGGAIRFTRRKGLGINLQKLMESPVTIRMRQGGERLRPDCNRPRRSLKNLLRETLLPPWERKVLPLMFSGDHLVWVPGIGVDVRSLGARGRARGHRRVRRSLPAVRRQGAGLHSTSRWPKRSADVRHGAANPTKSIGIDSRGDRNDTVTDKARRRVSDAAMSMSAMSNPCLPYGW